MGCCYEPPNLNPRSILPIKYVLPVRIIVLASIVAGSIFVLRHLRDLSPVYILGLFFCLLIAARALNECKKSVNYHRLLEEFERKISEPD